MEEEELHKHTPNPNCCGELETETESCRSGWSTVATSRWLEMELPLGMGTESSFRFRFRLEKAVCSHGLFMMAPNHWDPLSNSLTRPLLLHLNHNHNDPSSSTSLVVSISHSHHRPTTSLAVRVPATTNSLSPHQQHALLVPTLTLFYSFSSCLTLLFCFVLLPVRRRRFRPRCRECFVCPKRKRRPLESSEAWRCPMMTMIIKIEALVGGCLGLPLCLRTWSSAFSSATAREWLTHAPTTLCFTHCWLLKYAW